MLLKGLQSVDKAREWYTKRLAEVADKQRYGAPDTSDQSSTDQQQERINFEQLRINEVFINCMHFVTMFEKDYIQILYGNQKCILTQQPFQAF